MLGSGSTIDFGASLASILALGDSSGQTWTGTLTIANYTTGQDSLRFGTNGSALTSGQLGQISFSSYGGVHGQIDGSGFVTPLGAIPEPATVAATLGAFALAAAIRRRRRSASLSRSS